MDQGSAEAAASPRLGSLSGTQQGQPHPREARWSGETSRGLWCPLCEVLSAVPERPRLWHCLWGEADGHVGRDGSSSLGCQLFQGTPPQCTNPVWLRAVLLKAWFPGQQHQSHLDTCQECELSGPTPDLHNQKLRKG